MQRIMVWCALSALFAGVARSQVPPAAAKQVDFQRDVRPILAAKCFSCHGAKQQQSGLRLDRRQNALRGGDYGPVIVPGKAAESTLIKRLVSGDGGLQMPPTGPLDPEEIGILRAWIDQGGEYSDVDVREPRAAPITPAVRAAIRDVRSHKLDRLRIALRANPELRRARDGGGSTLLHHAAGFGTLEAMKLLLARGADPNAKNHVEATPLHWAVTDEAKVRLLLAHGARADARTYDGRTALFLAATQPDNLVVLRLLLDIGADPNGATMSGRTPLLAASLNGVLPAMKLLVSRGAKIELASADGMVPLLEAAHSRNPTAVQWLLERGADPNARTKRGITPLAWAARDGVEESVRLLLAAGANVNARDDRGWSPLMYAAYSDSVPEGIVKLFLAKGADTTGNSRGESPRTLAAAHGKSETARLLGVTEIADTNAPSSAIPASALNASTEKTLSDAIRNALSVLERQSPTFIKRGGCNSCHNQSLPSAALTLAAERGIVPMRKLAEVPMEIAERSPERTMNMAVISVNSVAYETFGFIGSRRPADEYTDSLVHYLKAMQRPEGYWQTTNNRPPLTFDHFLTTAMAIDALRVYSPSVESADTKRRLTRAGEWLEAAKPQTTQERSFRLLGLAWCGAAPAALHSAAEELLRAQLPDGGWAQLPGMESDAYATGEALYALQTAAKMRADDLACSKGLRYLLRTQAPDGSWRVKTRSRPFQPYFESGFPYGHDQWISAAGTSWAAMALSLAATEGTSLRAGF